MTIPFLLAPAALALPLLTSTPAAADSISACGNIDVEANASCSVEVQGGCEARCQPINFTAACQGECTASFSASCTGSCDADCHASCDVNPGSFECQGSCEADCNAGCEGHCAAEADQATCQGQCQASCSGECSVSCEATPPSADCDAKCEASCEGSCTAEANMGCHIDCQAELSGGCQVECQSPEGALFCDGQYVDHGGNLQECINALNSFLDVEVSGSFDAGCEGGTCSAEAEGSISCAIADGPAPSDGLPWFAAVALGIVASLCRRRRSE